MTSLRAVTLVALATTALTACSTYRQPYTAVQWSQKEPLQQAQKQALDNRFNEFLRLGYIKYADIYSGSGTLGSDHYAKKALLAERGSHPEPEELFLRRWFLSGSEMNALANARNQLNAAFARHARWDFPREAADAQLAFDCWVEEAEKAWGSNRMNDCRSAFNTAMAALSQPKAAPAMVVEEKIVVVEQTPTVVDVIMPAPFIVFFEFDKTHLAAGADAVLATVAAEYQKFNPAQVVIAAAADTMGTNEYNDSLSVRRGQVVKDRLVTLGLPAASISYEGKGERAPRIPTPDQTREQGNRYATITFVK